MKYTHKIVWMWLCGYLHNTKKTFFKRSANRESVWQKITQSLTFVVLGREALVYCGVSGFSWLPFHSRANTNLKFIPQLIVVSSMESYGEAP